MGAGGADQGLDLLGRLGRALGQGPHLRGHHRKAAAGVASPRRFHPGVQGQQVGLEGDLVDHPDDLGDLARALLDLVHGRDRLAHHPARALCLFLGVRGRGRRLARAAGAALDRGGDLVEGGRGLLQVGRLLFGAARQVVGSAGNLVRAAAHPHHSPVDALQGLAQAVERAVVVVLHRLVLGRQHLADARGQVAFGQTAQVLGQGAHQMRLGLLGLGPLGLGADEGLLRLGDVHRQLDHLVGPAAGVEHRVVGGLQPHLAPALGQAAELLGDETAAVQLVPEVAVLGAFGLNRVDEAAVMATLHLVQRITHGVKEIVVGVDDRAVEVELDHRLRAREGRHLGLEITNPLGRPVCALLLEQFHRPPKFAP